MVKQGKSIFLFVGLALLLLTGCKDKSTLLVKAWKVEDLKYNEPVHEIAKQNVDTWVASMKEDFSITYNADGTYETKFKDKSLKGKWKLNYNSSSINVVTDAGDKKTFAVAELTDSKYVFKADEAGKELVFTMIPK